jgi:hypothetical protein
VDRWVWERALPCTMLPASDSIFSGRTISRFCREIDFLDGRMVYHRNKVALRRR